MRWIVRGMMALAGLVVLAAVVVYGGSEWVIRKGHAVPEAQIAIPKDAASIAEGARMARIASCRECHAAEGQGKVLFEAPMLGRVAPPPLARVAAGMTDAELVRAIRHGVHKNGSSLFIMPAYALGIFPTRMSAASSPGSARSSRGRAIPRRRCRSGRWAAR